MQPTKPAADELQRRAAAVKLLVFDVDGVMTDGGLNYGPDGELYKRFDVKDGHAIVMARLVGLPAAILTARRSKIVEARGSDLGMVAILQGQKDKPAGFRALLEQLGGVDPATVAYMGDDVNDLGVFERVGLSACPSDAVPEARQQAFFVAQNPGGRGAVRELVELCLKASGKWNEAVSIVRGSPL
jgi:3-deoxy-D-manno-octulosonate 8-phosphate phosphatase (KDO 8-P phosphatase)